MITVLSVLALASTLAFAAAESGHLALGATRNRVNEARGFWRAQGCAAQVTAALDERWTVDDDLARERLWRLLDDEMISNSRIQALSCTVRLESGGARLDLGRTNEEGLARLIGAVFPGGSARSIAATVITWRDSLRLREADAFRGPLRRHALAARLRATHRLDGHMADQIVALLSAGTGPIDVGRAPVAVLAALPGFNARSAEALLRLREQEPHLRDLYAVLGRLAREDADAMSVAFLELSREVVFQPATWVLTVGSGSPAEARIEVSWSIGRSARHLVADSEAQ